jgi:inhibitor of cysteine peptidase
MRGENRPAKGSVTALAVLLMVIAIVAVASVGTLVFYRPGAGTSNQEELKRFGSCQEMQAFLEENTGSVSYAGSLMGVQTGAVPLGEGLTREDAAPAPANKDAGGQYAEDYSETNVQVEGVDEADVVKSDGKYLYVISGGKMVIVDAYPAEQARVVSETNVSGSPSELFINGDRLVVFTSDWRYWGGGQSSSVLVYDVTDRSAPVLVRNFTLEGSYYDSRMIGDYVYVISTKYVNTWSDPGIPRVASAVAGSAGTDRAVCGCSDVYYFDVPSTGYVFNTVTSLDVKDDGREPESMVFLMGYGQNLYVSSDNIYITYKKEMGGMEMIERAVNEVLIPALPPEVSSQMTEVMGSGMSGWEKQQEISRILMEYVEGLGPVQGASFMQDLQDRIGNFASMVAKEYDQSVAHRISISNGKIEYAAGGRFPGQVLNQFSMDEHDGYFRVATTTGGWMGGTRTDTLNHVYVLDSSMNVVGKLEDLARGESIYSARFMGDRLYMVTFERTDPLFVIDLSNPGAPTVLGELEMPGYSQYLHPYDENHIIGVGMDTEENEWGGVSANGVKLSLMDVTDVGNPREISRYVIGKREAYSYALYEHKAFLFDKEKELLVIPASVNEEVAGEDYWAGYWHGAYVFQVNLDDGITYRGRITHHEKNETESWIDYQYDVTRSMYMGDVLYTLSSRMLRMNSLVNLEAIGSVDLPGWEDRGGPLLMAEKG